MTLSKLNGEQAWAIVVYFVLQNKIFKSISGIQYQAGVLSDTIFYNGGNRNNGEEESINKKEFMEAFEAVRSLKDINTNTIKSLIPNSLYRKRTSFIGLLYSSGIIG